MCGSSSFTGYWENLLWEEAWDGTGLGLAKTRGWDIVMVLSLVFSIVYYCREGMRLLHIACYTQLTQVTHILVFYLKLWLQITILVQKINCEYGMYNKVG